MYISKPNDTFEQEYFIIGNGFDRALDLDTRYIDFINAIKQIDNICEKVIETVVPASGCSDTENLKSFVFKEWENRGASYIKEYVYILENYWYKYFTLLADLRTSRWVDFEESLSDHLSFVTKDATDLDGYVPFECNELLEKKLQIAIRSLGERFTYRQLIEFFRDQLDEFVHSLGIYFQQIDYRHLNTSNVNCLVNKIIQSKIPHIITFNYTHSLERILRERGLEESRIKDMFCYIHGECDKGNMVLGIGLDTYDTNNRINDLLDSFRKYYLRRDIESTRKYEEWMNDIDTDEPKRLTIFGHSLGSFDGQIIKKLIDAKNMRTNIYRFDPESKCTRNLSKYLGTDHVDELIENGILKYIPIKKCKTIK